MSESDKSYNIIAKRCYKPSMDGNKAPFVNFQKRMKKRPLSERRTMYRFLMFLPFIIVIIRYLFLKESVQYFAWKYIWKEAIHFFLFIGHRGWRNLK